ncbi:MAG: hypothetical protein VXY23_16675 [Pseudomonadota bacterium]|nr:hypothetical protein [Pseudomonadota bacterium]
MRIASVMVTVALGIAGVLLHSAPVSAKEWRLAVCYGKQATEVDKKYRNAIAQAAQDGLSVFDSNTTLQFGARSCVKEPDIACYADSEAIFCREEPLARVLRTSAWLVAESTFIFMQYEGNPQALEQVPSLSWVDALRMADAESDEGNKRFNQYADIIFAKSDLSADGLNAIYALVRDLYYYTNNDEDPGTDNPVLLVALDMYREVNQMLYAFLLGHEAYHFNGNQCPIAEPLKIEKNGIWKELYSLQLKNGLFNPAISLDKHELGGDLCGYRWLATSAKDDNKAQDKVLAAMSKRLAIDALASPMINGLLSSLGRNAQGQDVPEQKNVDGYLYPPTRLVLAALVLADEEKHYPQVVRACNDTAYAIVTSVQEEVRSYPATSGIIPDSFLAALPPGVEKAWNGGNWSNESVACKLKDK